MVFDCDGVILDSVDVKTRAFGQIVEEHGPEAVARMNEYHLANGGVSRFKKFEWFYREVLAREITQNELKTLGDRFSQLAFDGVMNAPMVAGAFECIKKLHNQIPLYVASGAPQDELTVVLEARNLTSFFKGVCGTPPNKTELLRRIIEKAGIAPKDTLMVGDSSTDLDAAQSCGARFFGIGVDFAATRWPFGLDCTFLAQWIDDHCSI